MKYIPYFAVLVVIFLLKILDSLRNSDLGYSQEKATWVRRFAVFPVKFDSMEKETVFIWCEPYEMRRWIDQGPGTTAALLAEYKLLSGSSHTRFLDVSY